MMDKADDAIALWQQMVGEMQKGFRTFGDQLSGGSSDRTLAGSDSAQKRLADLMESYFAGMNLPSRAQLNGISDRLQAIDSKLTDIKALLQEALMNSMPAQEAPQPSQPPRSPRAAGSRPKRSVKPRPVPAEEGAPAVPEEADKPE